jgi:hypothetical protein
MIVTVKNTGDNDWADSRIYFDFSSDAMRLLPGGSSVVSLGPLRTREAKTENLAFIVNEDKVVSSVQFTITLMGRLDTQWTKLAWSIHPHVIQTVPVPFRGAIVQITGIIAGMFLPAAPAFLLFAVLYVLKLGLSLAFWVNVLANMLTSKP